MATRVWNGATGDWTTDADWTPATSGNDVPNPGDAVTIASGTVILTTNTGPNQLFENNPVALGGGAGARLLLRDTRPVGRFFNVTIAGTATIEADGIRGFAGSIFANPNDGSAITLKADAGGELVFLEGGSFNVTDREVDFDGAVTLERNASVSGNIVNNGTLSILSGTTTFASNSLTGNGTIDIGGNGFLNLEAPVAATQTIDFSGTGAELALSYQHVGDVLGKIEGFKPGDFIDFVPGDGALTSETIDTVAHTLTIDDSTGGSYVYDNFYGAAGTLTSTAPVQWACSDRLCRQRYANRQPDWRSFGGRACRYRPHHDRAGHDDPDHRRRRESRDHLQQLQRRRRCGCERGERDTSRPMVLPCCAKAQPATTMRAARWRS